MSAALYNEIDPFAVRWLRNLITAGHIAPGVVDERSIADLVPTDVAGLGQRHFFAGIAGWSLALRLAGVPDDASIWTGSCPCQSLSDAGKRKGFSDERHLWPEWFRLISKCRPPVLFGEQVASGLGRSWLDLVFSDLEGIGYACAAADLPAAGVGAPHRRQRLLFVAYSNEERYDRGRTLWRGQPKPSDRCDCGHVADRHEDHSTGPQECGDCSCTYFVAHPDGQPGRLFTAQRQPGRANPQAERHSETRVLADTARQRRHGVPRDDGARGEQPEPTRSCEAVDVADAEATGRGTGRLDRAHGRPAIEPDGHSDDSWSPCDWIPCTDGVSRPVEPGTHPLAHGVSGRVGLLRGYGNAIIPEKVAAFIRAALEAA